MKKIALALTLLMLAFSGCASKPDIEYVKQPKFEFYKILDDTKGMMSVDTESKENQKVCTPYIVQATDMVYMLVEYHEDQIDRYNEYIGDNNDTRSEK